jgi:hypothetical protein
MELTSEVKAAAKRVEWIKKNLDTRGDWHKDDYVEFYHRDVVETLLPLADYALSRIAADEQAAKEDAEPVSYSEVEAAFADSEVTVSQRSRLIGVSMETLHPVRTKGELRRLLSALQGERQ